ncbi:MAG TPA: MFS transporter [Thermomicrobiales bacterium]|nr:MFS transporter [Thermomicrobiales bacterium]
MTGPQSFLRRTFASLSVRNYRLFFMGQAISLSGTWMQTVAQGLLVLELTGSGTALGLVTALQALPVLLFGAWGGVTADRWPKRNILYVTQSVAGVASLLVGALVITDHVQLWMIYALATVLGFVKVFDNPTRQTFVREMVGRDRLTNAVALNSTEMNLARVIGPTIAGITVATVGLGACFVVNGVSYAAVVAMLLRMRPEELRPAARLARARGQLGEGLRYVRATPVVRNTLLMMAIIGTFTYEFSVVLPLFSEFTFDAGASGYAALTAAMGVGAVVGGIFTAGRATTTPRMLVTSASLFGVSVLLAAIAPTLALAIGAMVIVGFFSINFTSLGNVTLQLESAPEMQGRVMSLWSIAFLGTTPIGGPLMGSIGEHVGARAALGIGGIAALVAAALGTMAVHRMAGHTHLPRSETAR